ATVETDGHLPALLRETRHLLFHALGKHDVGQHRNDHEQQTDDECGGTHPARPRVGTGVGEHQCQYRGEHADRGQNPAHDDLGAELVDLFDGHRVAVDEQDVGEDLQE